MTAIFHGDRATRSANGRYRLEALSPHNGTIPHRDGRWPSENEFPCKYRQHQSEFRYRLLDDEGRVVWERWQPRGEDSPGELVVSNDGWSVIRTHGFCQEVIAIRPDGKDAFRVRVEPPWGNPNRGQMHFETPTFEWVAERMIDSTAGYEWAGDSWRYFVGMNGRPFFVWRTWWGDRIVIDLDRAELIVPSEARSRALDAAEGQGVELFLEAVVRQLPAIRERLARPSTEGDTEPVPDDPLLETTSQLRAAIRIAGAHAVHSTLPVLYELESLNVISTGTGCETFTPDWLCRQWLRPAVQQAIRRLGAEPRGFPPYAFGDFSGPRMTGPECVPNRAERLKEIRLDRYLSPRMVLEVAGMPDFISRESRQVGRLYQGYELWEYDTRTDGRWRTTRLTWDRPSTAIDLTAVEQLSEDRVMSDERDSSIFEW